MDFPFLYISTLFEVDFILYFILDGLLVMDDRKARTVAEQKNLEVLTTADVLLLLLKENMINSTLFQLNLGKYSANGWLAPEIYKKYLTEGKKYE